MRIRLFRRLYIPGAQLSCSRGRFVLTRSLAIMLVVTGLCVAMFNSANRSNQPAQNPQRLGDGDASYLPMDILEDSVITADVEEVLDQMISILHDVEFNCSSLISVGGTCMCHLSEVKSWGQVDGEKPVCFDILRRTSTVSGCRAMSFGINNDFSFDLAMEQLDCTVHSFDPTMNSSSFRRSKRVNFHNVGLGSRDELVNDFRVVTMKTALSRISWQEGVIDYVKLDIESAEWMALQQVLNKDVAILRRVAQLTVEFHLYQWRPMLESTPNVFRLAIPAAADMLDVLRKLKAVGFRLAVRKRYLHCQPVRGRCLSLLYETLWINVPLFRASENNRIS